MQLQLIIKTSKLNISLLLKVEFLIHFIWSYLNRLVVILDGIKSVPLLINL